MLNYKYPRISEIVNGKKLAIWGVEHTREFFNQYKPLFINFVKDNDAIVLEQMVGVNFWESKGKLFEDLGELAREQGKKVYQVDPVVWGNVYLDLYQLRRDYAVQINKEISEQLIPYESALRKIFVNEHMLGHTPRGEKRTKIVEEVFDLFSDITGIKKER